MNATLSTVLALLLASTFWLVVGAMVARRWRTYTIGPVIILWCGHVALFWTTSVVRRLFFGYIGPSPFMTYWSIILYFQAGLSILGMLLLARRNQNP